MFKCRWLFQNKSHEYRMHQNDRKTMHGISLEPTKVSVKRLSTGNCILEQEACRRYMQKNLSVLPSSARKECKKSKNKHPSRLRYPQLLRRLQKCFATQHWAATWTIKEHAHGNDWQCCTHTNLCKKVSNGARNAKPARRTRTFSLRPRYLIWWRTRESSNVSTTAAQNERRCSFFVILLHVGAHALHHLLAKGGYLMWLCPPGTEFFNILKMLLTLFSSAKGINNSAYAACIRTWSITQTQIASDSSFCEMKNVRSMFKLIYIVKSLTCFVVLLLCSLLSSRHNSFSSSNVG